MRGLRRAEVPLGDDFRGTTLPEITGQTCFWLRVVRQKFWVPPQDPIFMGRWARSRAASYRSSRRNSGAGGGGVGGGVATGGRRTERSGGLDPVGAPTAALLMFLKSAVGGRVGAVLRLGRGDGVVGRRRRGHEEFAASTTSST